MVKELYTFNPLRDIGFDRVFARGTYLAPGINIVGDGFLTNIGRNDLCTKLNVLRLWSISSCLQHLSLNRCLVYRLLSQSQTINH